MSMTLEDLILHTDTKYHTDVFITRTLNFKPTQTENILRSNYATAVSNQLNNKFDGIPDDQNTIELEDIHKELFPNTQSFIDYIMARPHALAYIISRKADVNDKRKEVHELGLDEMRAILQAPNTCFNPAYDLKAKEEYESRGQTYPIPEFITDYKAQNLKVSVFKHLDGANQKQIIHQQNIEVKLLGNPKAPHGTHNPTLIGGNLLPHQRNVGPKNQRPKLSANKGNATDIKEYESPQEILNKIISGEESSIIDVTPMKAELMKQDEAALAERLEELREQEKVAQHVPKAKSKTPIIAKTPAPPDEEPF